MALWAGLPPALARGFLYGGLRLGLYSPLKDALAGLGGSSTVAAGSGMVAAGGAPPPQLSFVGKLLAGSLSGGVAAAITNPTELVKVRAKDLSHSSPYILPTPGSSSQHQSRLSDPRISALEPEYPQDKISIEFEGLFRFKDLTAILI